MTVYNLTEEIKQVFPQLSETQIVKLINNAHKELAGETKQLKARAQLSDISTNFAWDLPSDFVEFTAIRAYDSSDKPYYISDKGLEFEIEFDILYAKSLTSTPITAIPSEISKLYLHYVKSASAITLISDFFEIDERLHGGIKARVLQNLFATIPTDVNIGGQAGKLINLQAASYWEKQYERYLDKAGRLAHKKENTPGGAIFYPYAGKFNLPERPNDNSPATITTSNLSGLSAIYSKYAMLTVVEGQDAGTLIGQFGFTGTISATISGNTITIVSTESDFEQGVLRVEQANESIGWEFTDNFTLTFTAETGWLKDTIILIVDKT